MVNWSNGFSATYYATIVDPATWADMRELSVISGSISRKAGSELIESADIEISEEIDMEEWIRIYLIAQQGDEKERIPLFTGLASSPRRDIEGNYETRSLSCYSVLKVAKDILLPLGWFAPARTNGGELIRLLLSDLPCPVELDEGSPNIISSFVAGDDDSKLSIAKEIAEAINWQIKINGDGSVRICPKPLTVSGTFDNIENDIIETSVGDERDIFKVPNVVRVSLSGRTATARDDDPDSIYSTVNRGREIWVAEDAKLAAGESLGEYAFKRLKELQNPARTLDYKRRYQPEVGINDLVSIVYPKQKIGEVFRVTSQKISLTHGAPVREEVINE
ncbi:MAG: hypothetical protein J6U30_05860 [Oscillospiraceae bacterium]|nr:hypothetical protein [Oscillospiraceae bacterium]